MKTITFYSYKGGVGRTLVVANVAKYLAQFGLSVVALDFDLEAPGLHHKFALDGDELVHPRGIVEYLAQFHAQGFPPTELAPFTVQVAPPAGGPKPIRLMPAGNAPSAEYWSALSSIDWRSLLYEDRGLGVALFEDLRNRIEEDFQPDYLLIDARTGITEMSGIATTLMADVVVALTLSSREHLEGTRSVLRSINRTRRLNGDEPIQLEAVLSRAPAEEDDEALKRRTREVRDFLTDAAEDPEDTLSIDEVLVLQTDPNLQVHEKVLIGADLSSEEEEPPLLTDYLKLFTTFIPLESLEPRVKLLVDEAMDRLLEDPSSTERSLEALGRYTGHPEALRALIKFYRVRQNRRRMLDVAARLHELTGTTDLPLLWTAVREGMDRTTAYRTRNFPIDFAAEVWRAAGGHDVSVGLLIAEFFDAFSRHDEALSVMASLLEEHPELDIVVEKTIRLLTSAGRQKEAIQLARGRADDFAYDDDFVREWAMAVLQDGSREHAVELLEYSDLNLRDLEEAVPVILYRLYRLAGRTEQADAILEPALRFAAERRDYDQLIDLWPMFSRRGPPGQRHYESVVRAWLPDAGQFLQDLRARQGRVSGRPVR